MAEVSSMMPRLVNHHPGRPGMSEDDETASSAKTSTPDDGGANGQLAQSANGNGALPSASASSRLSDALFIQAKGSRLPPNSATTTIVQETLEEDQTIVIDLTEDRCNLTRRPTAVASGVGNSSKSSASVRQWSGGGGGSNAVVPPPPLPLAFATQDDELLAASLSDPLARLSSTTSSLDVQLGQESGSHFLISRMLNGSEEGDATLVDPLIAFPPPQQDFDDGREEILEITATVPPQHRSHHHRAPSASFHPAADATFLPKRGGQEEGAPPSGVILPSLRRGSIDESEEDDDRNLSTSIPTERYVEPAPGEDKHPISEEEGWPSLSSPAREPAAKDDRRSRSLLRRGDSGPNQPFNLFGSTSKSLSEVVPLPPARYSALSSSLHRLRSTDGYRSLDRRLVRADTASEEQQRKAKSVRARKSKSNDFLDRIDVSVSSTATSSNHHAAARARSRGRGGRGKQTPKLSKIEKGLYLGNMEAATDVILLESRAITHIVTLDSVPLPRKISSFLPRIAQLHLHVTDLPDEDILSHVTEAIDFIRAGADAGGNVLVHCFRGKSRSATVVLAYVMQKYRYSLEKALKKIKAKRECINPHDGFLAQLKLYEQMEYDLDPSNVQFKMFKLRLAAERMRKAKVLFRDSLDGVIDADPGENNLSPGDSLLYKCKRCRRTLATSRNLVPHVRGEAPDWHDPKWSLPAEEVLEGAADLGLDLCHPRSVFICPVGWMRAEVRQTLAGRLRCPNCQAYVGAFSWVAGAKCAGCGKGGSVHIVPAFQLDVTEIIFKTKNRYLQSSGREPVVV